MDFEWDPAKAAANRRKHGIDFVAASTVLLDELAVLIVDEGESSEERFVAVGADLQGRVLVVVFAWRFGRARLISARRATTHERRTYEEST